MTPPPAPSATVATSRPTPSARFSWLRRPSVWLTASAILALLSIARWPRATAVEAATVDRGPLAVTLDEEGVTRVRQIFVITAPVAGKVARIHLEPGDRVERGETLLAALLPADPTPLDERSRSEAEAAVQVALAALSGARAEARRATSSAEYAQAQLERYAQLQSTGVASAEALEARRTEAAATEQGRRAAVHAADAAAHEVAMARARIATGGARSSGAPIEIRSPIDGVVLRRLRESESVVLAGAPLLELGDPQQLEIVADYLSTDAVRIAAGQPATIERWGGAAPVRGRVRRVEPAGFTKVSALGVEEQRVNVLLDLVDTPAEFRDAVGDGFRVETRITVWAADSVVRVPSAALFRHGPRWAAYRIDRGRARLTDIELGERNEQWAEARAGLAEGTRVVLHPPEALVDGGRVRD